MLKMSTASLTGMKFGKELIGWRPGDLLSEPDCLKLVAALASRHGLRSCLARVTIFPANRTWLSRRYFYYRSIGTGLYALLAPNTFLSLINMCMFMLKKLHPANYCPGTFIHALSTGFTKSALYFNKLCLKMLFVARSSSPMVCIPMMGNNHFAGLPIRFQLKPVQRG